MSQVFISYSHFDSKFANDLFTKLSELNYSCFLDSENLHGGDNWAEKIINEIDNCNLFIILCSKHSNDSSQVLSEIVSARTRKKAIIPIKIEQFVLSGAMEYHLSAYQIIDGCSGVTANLLTEIIRFLNNNSSNDNYVKNDERLDFAPPKGANIKGPEIYESKDLLDMNYSSTYISMKHVELDYLTVDRKKYDIDDDIEGTLETWIEMIGETAECSAQLVSNNEIVGYLDFFPVSSEDYDLLVTNKKYFSQDVIAYYYFGGEYDIYGSMFSMNFNYTTPDNYFLFFNWMLNKLDVWNKNGIIINRITLSIYLDSQAKALKAIGFKMILNDRIKGMLFETTYFDLMNNAVLINYLKRKGLK